MDTSYNSKWRWWTLSNTIWQKVKKTLQHTHAACAHKHTQEGKIAFCTVKIHWETKLTADKDTRALKQLHKFLIYTPVWFCKNMKLNQIECRIFVWASSGSREEVSALILVALLYFVGNKVVFISVVMSLSPCQWVSSALDTSMFFLGGKMPNISPAQHIIYSLLLLIQWSL